MVDISELHICLNELHGHMDTKRVRNAVETLIKIHRNILLNKDNVQYRRIRLQNSVFYDKVWCWSPARRFMIQSGWTEVQDVIFFNKDEYLDDIIGVLLDHRAISPNVHEWREELKFENITDFKKIDDDLKKKAVAEREKELEEFRKDKIYREQLAKTIKAQIAEDRKNIKTFTKHVVGNKLNKISKVMSIHSSTSKSHTTARRLGEDLN